MKNVQREFDKPTRLDLYQLKVVHATLSLCCAYVVYQHFILCHKNVSACHISFPFLF